MILTKLHGLRALSDAERPRATVELALEIRELPAGADKVNLAKGLANLSTEGDFGRATLQEVADTLSLALGENPMPDNNGEPNPAYLGLAQLARYEQLDVCLTAPQYLAALSKVEATEKEREKADFTLFDLDGTSWTLSELSGNVVLVNFWATWCPPCRKEIADLCALYDQYEDEGLVILAISDEDAEKVKRFVQEYGVSYPTLLDPGRKVHSAFQIDGIPKTFIYNRSGRLVAQSIDMRTLNQFQQMLAKAGLQ